LKIYWGLISQKLGFFFLSCTNLQISIATFSRIPTGSFVHPDLGALCVWFLFNSTLLSTAEPEIKGEAKSIINRWQHLKAQHQQFSARWKEEYLKELHKRNKWQFPTRNLQADDMVFVKEDNLPSNEWRLGRIVSAFLGADDRIRVVEIRTSRGTIKRPVHKVILLPMEDKESSLPRD